MPIVDTYGQNKKHNIMAETWGHLYPEPGKKYSGRILVVAHDNQTMMLDRNFPGLCGSPMEWELVCSVLDKYEWTDGLHIVHCTLWFFKTCNDMYLGERIGKIIKAHVETIHSTENW